MQPINRQQGLSAPAQRDLTRGTPRCPSAGLASARLAGTLGAQGACGAVSVCPSTPSPGMSRLCLDAVTAQGVLQTRSLDAVPSALCLYLRGIQRTDLRGPPRPSAAAPRSLSRELHSVAAAQAARSWAWLRLPGLLHPRAGWWAVCPPVRSLWSP